MASLEIRNKHPETFLYSSLVRSHLGERASLLIEQLISLGRLTARDLAHHTELDLKSIRTAIVSLIQLRCVQYLEESGRTYYYYNEEGLLLLLYAGDIVNSVRTQFTGVDPDQHAVKIVSNVLTNGNLTMKDYLGTVADEEAKYDITRIFEKLVDMEYLVPINAVSYIPVADLWHKCYTKAYNAIPKSSTLSDLKKRTQAKGDAKKEFYKQLNEKPNLYTVDKHGSRSVAQSIPLGFSLERYMKHRRSRQIAKMAAIKVGQVPAAVLRVALSLSEKASPKVVDPLFKTGVIQELEETQLLHEELEIAQEKTPGVCFNAVEVSRALPAELNLVGTITSHKQSKRKKAQPQQEKRVKTEDGFVIPSKPTTDDVDEFDDDEDDDEDEDPHSVGLINAHLRLLATSTIPFLKEAQPGMFFVPYASLMPILKTEVYDAIISSTLGAQSTRVLRCVRANRLASEKLISSTALLKEKDIRTLVATLVQYNSLEIQEVPRTTDRSASRAVFLFRHNKHHACAFMKQMLAWNMGSLLYKNEGLKADNHILLAKANREDVKGREMELLLPGEINQLKAVNERETNGVVRMWRLLSLWEVFKLM